MNCCNDYGVCTRGDACPARSADAALVARIRASHALIVPPPAAAPAPKPSLLRQVVSAIKRVLS